MEQVGDQVDTRTLIENAIEVNPGIRYRELLRMVGLANGVLTYHLAALERENRIGVSREPGMTRYYPPKVSERESLMLKYVRHEPIRVILFFIYENENCTFSEIVEHAGKAPSTISSHLKRLHDDGIISIRYGEYQLYRIADKDLLSDVLSKYRTSYMDRVIHNYVRTVEEL
jgi:predicted transcriptional regulator